VGNESVRIGIIGTGQMGMPMAENLLASGYDLTVYSRVEDSTAELVRRGARRAHSPSELASNCEVVLLSLSTPQVVREIILGREGLAGGLPRGATIVDTSTIDPDTERMIYAKLRLRGIHLLDSPVSGGPEGARARTLTFMVGGEERIFRRCVPILKDLGRNIFYMGRSGSGQATKLVNQLLVSAHTLATAEAVLYASFQRLDMDKVRRVIETSAGDSFVFRRASPSMISHQFGRGWQVFNLYKDLGLIAKTSSGIRRSLATPKRARAIFKEALQMGLGKTDSASIIRILEEKAGDRPPHRRRRRPSSRRRSSSSSRSS
jgi:3-hydroxyisobutyrate dehydrogenase-like beta-hydroxyacid dehydrogenase